MGGECKFTFGFGRVRAGVRIPRLVVLRRVLVVMLNEVGGDRERWLARLRSWPLKGDIPV